MQVEPTEKTLDIRREIKQCPACGRRFSREATFCPADGAALDSAGPFSLRDPLVGGVVDRRYEVLEILGEGGMGRVYRVRHAHLGRTFAMKMLRPELARDADLAARFIREAKATASVKHPNVVQITDFGRLPDGTPYFVMELLVGRTLAQVLKASGPLPVTRAVAIVEKVAGGLAAAHAAGVVHRDLKPDNVFFVGDSDADLRVVDFGAAKIVGSDHVTRAGMVFGTPHYMSPEQAGGQPVDHRADVYSLGVIMYEMLSGRVPFEADTYMGVLTQHMFVPPTVPSELVAPGTTLGPLEGITLTCLEKAPEDRFASMDELVRALRQVGTLAPAVAPRIDARIGSGDWALPRRRPGPWWAVAVAAALAAGALALWLRSQALRSRSEPGPTPQRVSAEAPVMPPVPVSSSSDLAGLAPLEVLSPPGSSAPARPVPRRPPVPRASPAPKGLDDVGDPFTASP